jgi:hypothetical protein
LDPVILTPDVQFKDFLSEMNESFPSDILDPARSDLYWRKRSVLLDFPEHPRLAPRFLGVSDSQSSFDKLFSKIPKPSLRGADNVFGTPLTAFDENAFTEIVQEVEEALSTTRTRSRQVRKTERAKIMYRQMRYAQKFLGLRPTLGWCLREHR